MDDHGATLSTWTSLSSGPHLVDGGGVAGRHLCTSTVKALVRGLLLAAVLAGIFGMHVLSAEDGSGGHGALPTVEPGVHSTMAGAENTHPPTPMAALAESAAFLPDPGSGMDHGDMAGCILFLVAGTAALLLVLVRHRRSIASTDPVRRRATALTDLRRRGPPGRYRPRVALCVIRI